MSAVASLFILPAVSLVALVLLGIRSLIVLPFYRGYFLQKQINAGKDPFEVLRKEFPLLWRLF